MFAALISPSGSINKHSDHQPTRDRDDLMTDKQMDDDMEVRCLCLFFSCKCEKDCKRDLIFVP